MKRRLLCLLLALCLLPVLPVLAGDETVDGWETLLGEGVSLHGGTLWTGADYRSEHYITLSPGAALRPVAVSGEALCSAGSLAAAAERLEAQGLHVVAGTNGGYYGFGNLNPVGIVVSGGVLRSSAASNAWMQAIGFRADGGVLLGKPAETLRLTVGERTVAVEALNLNRGEGLTAYTPDFTSDHATRADGDGWNVICALDGALRMGGSAALTVREVRAADGNVEIPADGLVLSLAGDTEGEAPDWIAALRPGDEMTLRISCAEGWETVDSALGLLYPLIENGAVAKDLGSKAEPRTAVGLKADGSLLIYTVDGRRSGYSVGMGLDVLAQRMLELGCVEAATLDGGGSTLVSAVLPGDETLTRISTPSGANERSVVNYVLLVTEAQPTHQAARLALYPMTVNAVAGAEIPLTVKAVDENGYAAAVPAELTFTVTPGLGTVEDGVLRCAGGGSGTVTVSAPGLESVSVPLRVTETPDRLAFYGEVYGLETSSLTLSPGQEVDLTVRAWSNHVLLSGGDECYSWTLESAAGTVDATGHLIPASVTGRGMLTASLGEQSVSIPITVWTGVPFTDVSTEDACFPAVRYAYEHKLFNGVSETEFAPEVVMNRGMLVTVLWRMNGAPEGAPQPGFEDVKASDWFGPAVAWAVETGLVKGYDAQHFGPADDLTKEQILTILHRYAGLPAVGGASGADADGAGTDESGTEEDGAEEDDARRAAAEAVLERYADADAVGAWAREAVAWAADQCLFDTDADLRLLPAAPMRRADVAEVLMRYLELPE